MSCIDNFWLILPFYNHSQSLHMRIDESLINQSAAAAALSCANWFPSSTSSMVCVFMRSTGVSILVMVESRISLAPLVSWLSPYKQDHLR